MEDISKSISINNGKVTINDSDIFIEQDAVLDNLMENAANSLIPIKEYLASFPNVAKLFTNTKTMFSEYSKIKK